MFVAVVVAIALAVTAWLMLVEDGPAAASYPPHWDARVEPYAKIAEKSAASPSSTRWTVRFLPAAEFEKTVRPRTEGAQQGRTHRARQFAGLMRAFGLITGDVDLFAAFNDVSGGGTLAYYSFKDERITIRGQRVTPAVRSTLVHELTHALQDQHFEVGNRLKKLGGLRGRRSTSADVGASTPSSRAMPSASRACTANRCREEAQGCSTRAEQGEFARADKRLKRVPKVVVTMMTAPYILGEGLVQAVAADGGNTDVDELFRTHRQHETALLDPFEVLAGDTDATKVDVPKLEDGEKKFDSGELGVLTWYLMLAERLPLLDALEAADGWGGDAYVAFERDGDSCARMTYVGDTRRDGDADVLRDATVGRRRTGVAGIGPPRR